MPELPPAPAPRGRYRAATAVGDRVFSAGMTPRRGGELLLRGRVGDDVDPADAARAAGIAAENALAALTDAAGGPGRLEAGIRMAVYVACSDGFTAISEVADGATEAVAAHLGEAGLPVRTAVGVRSLPGGAPVEVELSALAR